MVHLEGQVQKTKEGDQGMYGTGSVIKWKSRKEKMKLVRKKARSIVKK